MNQLFTLKNHNNLRIKTIIFVISGLFFSVAISQEPFKNHDKSPIEALIKAAHSGDAEAQYQLSFRYAKGIDLEKNDEQTFFWIKKAAEQGLQKAQFILAGMYQYGLGTSKDPKKASFWYAQYSK